MEVCNDIINYFFMNGGVFMNFLWCTIRVNNLEESINFYEFIVGLQVNTRFQAGPNKEIAFLGNGETKVELIWDKSTSTTNVGPDISIGFEVDSVDEKLVFLKERNIPIQSEVIQPNPHTKFFYVLDPNGLKIQFVENI
jgi:lactoylglutathione lyase